MTIEHAAVPPLPPDASNEPPSGDASPPPVNSPKLFERLVRRAREAGITVGEVLRRLYSNILLAIQNYATKIREFSMEHLPALVKALIIAAITAVIVPVSFAIFNNLIGFIPGVGSVSAFNIWVGGQTPTDPEIDSILQYRNECQIADPDYWDYKYFFYWNSSERKCWIVWSMYYNHEAVIDAYEKRRADEMRREHQLQPDCNNPFIVNPDCEW